MEKLVYFNIAALIVLIVILVSTHLHKLTKNVSSRIFVATLVVVFFSIIFGIFGVWSDNGVIQNKFIQYISHLGYLLTHNFTAGLYLVYLISITDTIHKYFEKKYRFAILLAPLTITFVLLFVNLFYPCVFHISETGEYVRGSCFLILYINGIILLVYGLYYIITFRKLFTTKTILSLFSFYPLLITAMIIEYFYGYLCIELFVTVLALLFVYLNVQRPEDIIEKTTNFYNSDSFISDCDKMYKTNKQSAIIFININEHKVLLESLGLDKIAILNQKISNVILSNIRVLNFYCKSYYLLNGEYRIQTLSKNERKVIQLLDRINNEIKQIHKVNDQTISITPLLTYVHMNKDVKTPEELFQFQTYIRNIRENKILSAKSLFQTKEYQIARSLDRIIDESIKNKSFEVYFQPIYSIPDDRFVSCEALLRLYDEELGYINPELIAKHAERNGSISKITDFVLDKVLRFVSSHEFEESKLKTIHINVSILECVQPDFAERIISTIRKYHVNPEIINLELTETSFSFENTMLISSLLKLRNAGIKLSVDDFGNGYSNIRRLLTFPLEIAKLDKSLVDHFDDQKTQVLLKNLIKLIKDIPLKVVIEGVETEKQVQFFKEIGCEYIQGYYYAMPMSLSNFISYIKNKNSK